MNRRRGDEKRTRSRYGKTIGQKVINHSETIWHEGYSGVKIVFSVENMKSRKSIAVFNMRVYFVGIFSILIYCMDAARENWKIDVAS